MDAEEAAFDRENHRIGAGNFEQVSMMWTQYEKPNELSESDNEQ
jgi:hypothetical protein